MEAKGLSCLCPGSNSYKGKLQRVSWHVPTKWVSWQKVTLRLAYLNLIQGQLARLCFAPVRRQCISPAWLLMIQIFLKGKSRKGKNVSADKVYGNERDPWGIISQQLMHVSVQFSSVAQSCLTLWDPMNRSMPGLLVHHQLPQFTQTHVHRVSDGCHPAISSSVVPFSSCPQSLPASGSFQMSQLFAWSGQSTGVSASASVPSNEQFQDWSPLGWTGWISLQSKGLSRVFSNTTVQKHHCFILVKYSCSPWCCKELDMTRWLSDNYSNFSVI